LTTRRSELGVRKAVAGCAGVEAVFSPKGRMYVVFAGSVIVGYAASIKEAAVIGSAYFADKS